MHLCF
jgi:DNA methyltransferase 1-associated protein 1